MEYQVTKVITYWVMAETREEALAKVKAGKVKAESEYLEAN
jgi:hypothetical protein